ncbi:MAG TPA: hypothetical protein VNL71_01655 [Chloroflexota bacterium]|nr:hypothetical protein [Chloroflexota bacterium]
MLRVKRSPARLVAVGVLAAVLAINAVGNSHVPALAQGHTMPLRYTEQGTYLVGSAGSRFPFIGGSQAQVTSPAGLPAATDGFNGVLYAPAANGCQAGPLSGAYTFGTSGDQYDFEAVATSCPVAGQPSKATAIGSFVITGGTGRFKGAGGGGTFNANLTLLPAKPGQPLVITYTDIGTGSIILAGQ